MASAGWFIFWGELNDQRVEPTVSQGLFQFYNSPFLSFSWPFSDFSEYFLLLTTISNFVFINF